ncbi:MAG: glycosyltransferase [Gemmatimonadaceae bacterium]
MLTVAICTWRRAALLRRTLANHAAARLPAGLAWELIVVDNDASTDEVQRVVDEFAGRLPVRCVLEPTLGLSRARNAAVRAALGTYVLWTDDDVLVPPTWIAAYARAIARWPDAAVLGGPIRPHFDARPPEWLRQALPVVAHAFSLLELGREPVPFGGTVLPFGANYAVRAAEQRCHLYSPALGRIGDFVAMHEETEVVRAILREGGVGWYVPWAPVRHIIPESRQSVHYLRHYFYGNGASTSRLRSFPTLFGRPLWMWRRAVQHEVLYHITRPFARPERWALHMRLASSGWGLLHAGRGTARTRAAL